jgi:4a-hydroxytetrahydrobiopterin dehydratase
MMEKLDEKAICLELKKMSGWKLNNSALEKEFVFPNFKAAISRIVRIAFEAELMNHHPEWTNVYNKLKIRLRTHDADGVTEKDFILAKKIDEIAKINYKQ